MNFDPDLSPELQQLKQELLVWRSENKAPKRIPSEIWEQAAQFAREHGVGPVARTLRLDFACLKRRALGAEVVKTTRSSPAFFELFQPPIIQSCVLDLESPRGAKVRLEFGASAPGALAAFVRELGL